jgi:hypothetical protein
LGRLVRCPTPELVAFNARIWKDRKDQGLDINEPLEGVVILESLKLFEADLVRMSSGGGVVFVAGSVPPELWNKLGSRLIPKLRDGTKNSQLPR